MQVNPDEPLSYTRSLLFSPVLKLLLNVQRSWKRTNSRWKRPEGNSRLKLHLPRVRDYCLKSVPYWLVNPSFDRLNWSTFCFLVDSIFRPCDSPQYSWCSYATKLLAPFVVLMYVLLRWVSFIASFQGIASPYSWWHMSIRPSMTLYISYLFRIHCTICGPLLRRATGSVMMSIRIYDSKRSANHNFPDVDGWRVWRLS